MPESIGLAGRGSGRSRRARCRFTETRDPEAASICVSGEILAFDEATLGRVLERVMREITSAAATSDALLETRGARHAPPRSTPVGVLEALAADLRGSGFRVRFAPCWTPVPESCVALGIRGAEHDLVRFVRDHPAWELA